MRVGSDEALFFRDDSDWQSAQQALCDAGLGDGLPLVVPTTQRLDAMLAGVADRQASDGPMPPMFGDLTVEALAYCGLLAGCTPAMLPVVAAAAAATLRPEFNLLGIQTTTGSAAVCLVVHGPLTTTLGMNAGTNCLGPGNRANASIGRALQLVLRNIGGARPGTGDMATIGQPGKYAFCLAEGAHPLLPPLAERRGFASGRSAVTVVGVSGTLEVLPRHDGPPAESVLLALADAMHGGRLAHDAGRQRPCEEQVVLLPPECADRIRAAGWDLQRARRFVWEHSPRSESGAAWPLAPSPEQLVFIAAGGPGIKMACLVPWGGGSTSVTVPVG